MEYPLQIAGSVTAATFKRPGLTLAHALDCTLGPGWRSQKKEKDKLYVSLHNHIFDHYSARDILSVASDTLDVLSLTQWHNLGENKRYLGFHHFVHKLREESIPHKTYDDAAVRIVINDRPFYVLNSLEVYLQNQETKSKFGLVLSGANIQEDTRLQFSRSTLDLMQMEPEEIAEIAKEEGFLLHRDHPASIHRDWALEFALPRQAEEEYFAHWVQEHCHLAEARNSFNTLWMYGSDIQAEKMIAEAKGVGIGVRDSHGSLDYTGTYRTVISKPAIDDSSTEALLFSLNALHARENRANISIDGGHVSPYRFLWDLKIFPRLQKN